MKAITLTQPYATLVAMGAKRIETRGWSTRYRGPLAIHAGKGLGPVGGKDGLQDLHELAQQILAGNDKHLPDVTLPDAYPRGCVVAVAYLDSCIPTDVLIRKKLIFHRIVDKYPQFWRLGQFEYMFGDYAPGRYAWLLADVRLVDPPIPATGRQGLWEWTGSEAAQIL
jgi:hypothetical protein